MELLTADYVLLGIAGLSAILGLFIGFSGALAFLVGTVAAVVAGRVGWALSPEWLEAMWSRALATGAVALVSFGLARLITRKIARGLLAQPADAIFGILVSALTGFALALSAAYLLVLTGILPIRSVLMDEVLAVFALR